MRDRKRLDFLFVECNGNALVAFLVNIYVKAEDYSLMFSVPIKGRSRCYSSLHCKETVEYSQRRENVIYRDRNCVVQLLLQLENKQQIM